MPPSCSLRRLTARRFLAASLLVLWPTLLGFGPPSLVESDDVRLPIGSPELQMLSRGRPPPQVAQASLILDLPSGRVVFQRNARTRLAPASITKVMTAVLVLEHGNLQNEVTIVREDLVEGSSMGLQPGETLTVEQLLWGLLLPSGNDAANALARALGGGSVPRFVEMMDEKARILRLNDTHFMNPHGLDEENHYSTAYDLAQLSRYALRNPLFAKIVATREYTFRANRTFTLQNTNQLLYVPSQVPGVTGVKTGFLGPAGDSLVASVERDGHQVVVVVLGAPNRVSAATTLINYAYSQFTWVPLPLPLASSGSSRGRLAPAIRGEAMVPLWQKHYVNFSLDIGEVPQESPLLGPVGLLTYYLAGQELDRLALYVQSR